MTGTLELLCGPSGVGKTSSIDGVTKSYRWTTRPIREGEIDSREYDGTKSTHGFFVTAEEFDSNLENLVAVHQYPDDDGEMYGFPKKEIKEALESGEDISEQIVDFDSIDEVANAFENVEKRLFLGLPHHIEMNLLSRGTNQKEFESRSKNLKEVLIKYCDNINYFDDIYFNIQSVLSEESFKEMKQHHELLFKNLETIIVSVDKKIKELKNDREIDYSEYYDAQTIEAANKMKDDSIQALTAYIKNVGIMWKGLSKEFEVIEFLKDKLPLSSIRYGSYASNFLIAIEDLKLYSNYLSQINDLEPNNLEDEIKLLENKFNQYKQIFHTSDVSNQVCQKESALDVFLIQICDKGLKADYNQKEFEKGSLVGKIQDQRKITPFIPILVSEIYKYYDVESEAFNEFFTQSLVDFYHFAKRRFPKAHFLYSWENYFLHSIAEHDDKNSLYYKKLDEAMNFGTNGYKENSESDYDIYEMHLKDMFGVTLDQWKLVMREKKMFDFLYDRVEQDEIEDVTVIDKSKLVELLESKQRPLSDYDRRMIGKSLGYFGEEDEFAFERFKELVGHYDGRLKWLNKTSD
jgi:guanylate kinase